MHQSGEVWRRVFQEKHALWIHDRNSKRPHAELTSGKHSSGFFNGKLITEDALLLERASADLILFLQLKNFNVEIIDRVVGPATGATTLAKCIANYIGMMRTRKCFWASPEKDGVGDEKKMVFRDSKVLPDEIVLLCEDTLTTGGSVRLAADAVERAGGITLPFVLALVNRSGLTHIGGKSIVALIDHPMPTWLPNECPLCKAGSEAIRPKGDVNWARLNAAY